MNEVYKKGWINKILICIGAGGVALTFLYQDFSFLGTWDISEQTRFILRKSLRVLLNDLFMLIFVAAWFKDQRITKLAVVIQLLDSFILLPIYLIAKLTIEGASEISIPLLSQFHRIIINPTLMVLLIPAVYFQRFSKKG